MFKFILQTTILLFIIIFNSNAAPVVHFNLREFLGTLGSTNVMNFYVHPGATTNLNWRSSATKQTSGSSPLLYTGQDIQLNGEVFWKENNASNGFIIGFIPTNHNTNNGRAILKCIKDLDVDTRFATDAGGKKNPQLPNTHWKLRFRAPSQPGQYHMFIVNLVNVSTSNTIRTTVSPFVNTTYNTICNFQNPTAESPEPGTMRDYQAYEVTTSPTTNTLKLLMGAFSGASYDTNKVFTGVTIEVENDQCAASSVSLVNWPATDAGVTVTATNSMCNPSSGNGARSVVSTTTRTCNRDSITGEATGWGSVSGPGCKQRCYNPAVPTNVSRSMRLPQIVEDDIITIPAGAFGKALGEIPIATFYQTSNGTPRTIPSYTPCFDSTNTLFTNRQITIGCSYNSGSAYGTYTYSNNGVCTNFSSTSRPYQELWHGAQYSAFTANFMPAAWGRYGVYEAVYSGANPLAVSSSSLYPADGDRVLTLIDHSWGNKHIDLSGVDARYRTADGGGVEIPGRVSYDTAFSNDLGGRFAVLGLFSFVNAPPDWDGRNLLGINHSNVKAFLTIHRNGGGSQWVPVFRYAGKPRWAWGYDSNFAFSYTADNRTNFKKFSANTPAFLAMMDTTLDEISYNKDWEWESPANRRFSDCKWDDGWGNSGGREDVGCVSSCAAIWPQCGRYAPIYFEKSPVKFMASSDQNFGGNDWTMYFHPQNGSRKLVHTSTSDVWLNGIGSNFTTFLGGNTPSIILGETGLTFILHEANIIQWDTYNPSYGGGSRVIDSRFGPPFINQFGWRNYSGVAGQQMNAPIWYNSGGHSRQVTNNFFLDRQRTLETYYLYDTRYWWSTNHGTKDTCPGNHWTFNSDLYQNLWDWGDPCWFGSGNLNWGDK